MDNLVIVLLILLVLAVVAGVFIAAGRFKRDRQQARHVGAMLHRHVGPVSGGRRYNAVPTEEAEERVIEEPERTPPRTPDVTYVEPTVEARSIHDVTDSQPGTCNTDSGTA